MSHHRGERRTIRFSRPKLVSLASAAERSRYVLMYDEADIREKLVDSCPSSTEAREFFMARLADQELLALLMKIAENAEDWDGAA